MKENLWLTIVTCLAYCLDKELWKAIEYLKEQVRVLKEQLEKQKRILLDNRQKTRLAAKAKRLTPFWLGIADSSPRSTTAARIARVPVDRRSPRRSSIW
jgi:hypothetical protein